MVDKLTPPFKRSLLTKTKELWSSARSLITAVDSCTAATESSDSTASSSGQFKSVRFAKSVKVRYIPPKGLMSDQHKQTLYYTSQERRAMRINARSTASVVGRLYPDHASGFQRVWSKAHVLADSRNEQELRGVLNDFDAMSACALDLYSWTIFDQNQSSRGLETLFCYGRKAAARESRALVINKTRDCFSHERKSSTCSIALQYAAATRYASIIARVLAVADATEPRLEQQPTAVTRGVDPGMTRSQRLAV